MMRKALTVTALAGLAVAFRRQLLHVLTRFTGTWVGTER